MVELQHTTNYAFIDRIMGHCLHIKKEDKVAPVALVYGVAKTCNNVSEDYGDTDELYIKKIESKYWAKHCYFEDSQTITAAANDIQPLQAIGISLSSQKPSLISIKKRNNTTIQLLYQLAKSYTAKDEAENPITTVLLEVCNQTNLQFQKLVNVIGAMPDSLLKKRALEYADDGVFYTDTCTRKCFESSSSASPMSVPLELPEESLAQIESSKVDAVGANDLLPGVNLPQTDMDYCLQYKETFGSINWNACYQQGKDEGYFTKYSTATSLRRAYNKKNPNNEE